MYTKLIRFIVKRFRHFWKMSDVVSDFSPTLIRQVVKSVRKFGTFSYVFLEIFPTFFSHVENSFRISLENVFRIRTEFTRTCHKSFQNFLRQAVRLLVNYSYHFLYVFWPTSDTNSATCAEFLTEFGKHCSLGMYIRPPICGKVIFFSLPAHFLLSRC